MRKLYPCVVYFDKDTEKEIVELQETLFKITGSKSSLVEWRPHFTIGNAPTLDNESLKNLEVKLNSFAKTQSPFEVEIGDFMFVDNWGGSKLFNCEPYLVAIKVRINPELLSFVERLSAPLKKFDMDYNNIVFPYSPHITLAFKDMDKLGFEKAKKFLKNVNFAKKIKINSFYLLVGPEDLNGKFEECMKFDFGE